MLEREIRGGKFIIPGGLRAGAGCDRGEPGVTRMALRVLPNTDGRFSRGLLEEEENIFGAHHLFVEAFAKHAMTIDVRVLINTHWK